MLAEALFERIDVLGAREATIRLTDTAVAFGFAAAIPDRLDVDGPEIVAAYLQPNENAWLLGLVSAREGRLQMQQVMGLVGARGFDPTIPTCRIVVPSRIAHALVEAVS